MSVRYLLCAKQRAPTFCIGPEADSTHPTPQGRRQVLRVGGGGGGGEGGGRGLIMVGDLDPRDDKRGVGGGGGGANYGWGFSPAIRQ